MTEITTFIISYGNYLALPLVGAFIGYFTNKIAIRMLFRPLKQWKIFGLPVPMTPGVIPSKRKLLATNIGEMVGEHLLTSKEISKGLQKENFQEHLYTLIQNRVESLFNTDLGPLPTIIPKNYNSYFDIGRKTLIYNIKELLYSFFASTSFEVEIKKAVGSSFDDIVKRDIDAVLSKDEREKIYVLLERTIGNMLSSNTLEQWVEDCVYNWVQEILKSKKSLNDILPDSLIEFLVYSIESKTPELLQKFSDILQDEEIQEKLLKGLKNVIDSFASSLGPMGAMVQNFITLETLEKMLKQYLKDNKEDIARWLENEKVQGKVAETILDRFKNFLSRPLVEMVADGKRNDFDVNGFCKNTSLQISGFLKREETTVLLASMLRETIEIYLKGGNIELEKVAFDLFGRDGMKKAKIWLQSESISILTSQKAKQSINLMVERIVESLLQKRIGKISDILPLGVREGIYRSLQKMAIAMLAVEVPGLVSSLNIKTIVTDKVNSLDLLRLERLLLSIMEEQFKYINLFGALLGCIIGSLNIVFFAFF